ncbi:MAG: glycosyl hydrolase [Clostridiales bacterium]|jgi:spore germination protein YaaH|nr:glycosyl hydrolase [Clostridiales bacterium]
MEVPLVPQTNRKKTPMYLIPLTIAITLVSILVYYYPAFLRFHTPNNTVLIVNGQKIHSAIYVENNEILIPVDVIRDKFDPDFYYDRNTKIAIVTTKDKVLEMKTDKLTGYINSEEISFEAPIREINGKLFVPIEVLAPLYKLDIEYYDSANSVVIRDKKRPVQKAVITSDYTFLRKHPTLRSPWILKLKAGEEVTVYKEENNWLQVLTTKGKVGYIKESKSQLIAVAWEPYIRNEVNIPWSPLGGKINLTWDNVYSRPYSFSKAPFIKGANVLSPTWFHLTSEGYIKNQAYKPYVEWAHENNYQVWALFSNSFDPDLTHRVLSDPVKRKKVRNQLLVLAELYQLDGINIDFENMYYEDKDLFVQFIKEITPFLHEMDLTVSVDVTVLSQSKRWSLVYDRKTLGDTVDYMIIMAYDQYPHSSKVAGPVSSIYWTERKLKEILEIVPHDKLILGVPFYTRLWREQKTEDDNIKVTSQALSMENAEKLLHEHNVQPVLDTKTGLMYGEYKEGDSKYKIWLETAQSMRKRVDLIKKYDLAGLASWRRGFEKPEIWDVIAEEIEKRP